MGDATFRTGDSIIFICSILFFGFVFSDKYTYKKEPCPKPSSWDDNIKTPPSTSLVS